MKIDHRKAAVIGCGNVGASIAFRFLQQGLFTRLVLLDANRDKAEGEAMDLRDGLPYGAAMEISAGDYDDLTDCALAVITAGANQKPGETRLDLIGKNTEILRSVLKEVTARNFGGILLVVSNPVDVLTYAAWRLSGYPRERVMGSGTVLDTGRLKQLLGAELEVDSRNIHAFIIGEHGDSELAVWSEANVSGLDLEDFCRVRGHKFTGREPRAGDGQYIFLQRKQGRRRHSGRYECHLQHKQHGAARRHIRRAAHRGTGYGYFRAYQHTGQGAGITAAPPDA